MGRCHHACGQIAARLTHMSDQMWLAYGVPLLADGITTLILIEGNYLLMCFSPTFNHDQSLLPGGTVGSTLHPQVCVQCQARSEPSVTLLNDESVKKRRLSLVDYKVS